MTDNNTPLTIIPGDAISKAVQAYELPDQKIQIMKDYCAKIEIAGPNDKENYKLAKTALSRVRSTRTAIEAKRKELKQPALDYGRAVDEEAKRLTAIIEPVEADLRRKVDAIDKEKERIEAERRNNLHNEMLAAGFKMQAGVYVLGTLIYSQQQVWDATVEQLKEIYELALGEVRRIEAEQAELERLRKLAEQAEVERTVQDIKRKDIPPYVPPADPFANIPAPTSYAQNVTVDPNAAPASDHTNAHHPHEQAMVDTPETVRTTPQTTLPPVYIEGFKAAQARIIEILNSPEKLTRAQWIDKISRLKP
jgi:hypothetical protein